MSEKGRAKDGQVRRESRHRDRPRSRWRLSRLTCPSFALPFSLISHTRLSTTGVDFMSPGAFPTVRNSSYVLTVCDFPGFRSNLLLYCVYLSGQSDNNPQPKVEVFGTRSK